MTISETKARSAPRPMAFDVSMRVLRSPIAWLLFFAVLVAAGLALPIRIPLGPNYWDTDIYLDAIHRIGRGQIPSVDFFAPVGPLGYYLAAVLDTGFPRAQPMLLANWAILPVALPILGLVVAYVDRGSRTRAFALLLPFLAFAALPINLHSLYPSPGFDGFGHYNRHIALLLYVLVAALLFVDSRRLLTGLVAALMLALFLVKITGAVSGALLVGYAVLAGRLRFRDAALAAGIVLVALGVLDLGTAIVREYLGDVLTLISLNTGSLLPRFMTVASVKFNVVAPSLLLAAVLAVVAWRDEPAAEAGTGLARHLASPLGWFLAVFAALTLFETQNSGSLEYLGLWPVLMLILAAWWQRPHRLQPLVLLLVMAVVLPSAVIVMERAGRAILAAPGHATLAVPGTGPLGRVGLKRDLAERAQGMLDHYAAHQESYRDLVRRDLLPSDILFSEIDYQAAWLLELQQALTAIDRWERDNRRRLNGFFSLDFVNPLNHLLDREPPRHVSIGIDPNRTNPEVTPPMAEALRSTDAILVPKCPLTTDRATIAKHFERELTGRRLVALSPCWDMHLKP